VAVERSGENNFRDVTSDILWFQGDLTEHYLENSRASGNADRSIN
jgi:hypothetical protein